MLPRQARQHRDRSRGPRPRGQWSLAEFLGHPLGQARFRDQLEIQELRDEYRQAKGATLRQFHDAFVAQGGLPIPLVRRILMR